MTKQEALRAAVRKIRRHPADYDWDYAHTCNCGILAQAVTGLSGAEIREKLTPVLERSDSAHWSAMVFYCSTSRLQLNVVIERLFAVGFSIQDIRHIELLADPEVLSRMRNSGRDIRFRNAVDVTAYFEAFADLLDEAESTTKSLPSPELLSDLSSMKAATDAARVSSGEKRELIEQV